MAKKLTPKMLSKAIWDAMQKDNWGEDIDAYWFEDIIEDRMTTAPDECQEYSGAFLEVVENACHELNGLLGLEESE